MRSRIVRLKQITRSHIKVDAILESYMVDKSHGWWVVVSVLSVAAAAVRRATTDLGVLRGRACQLGPARVGAQDVLQVLVPRLQLCTTQRAHAGGVRRRQVEPLGCHVATQQQSVSAQRTDARPRGAHWTCREERTPKKAGEGGREERVTNGRAG